MRCAVGLVLGLFFALLASCLGAEDARAQNGSLAADPQRASSRADVDAFAREVDAMAEGRTRAEADFFLGEVYRARFGAFDAAEPHYRRAAQSPALDALTRRLARGGLVDVLLARGARDDASRVAAESGDAELVRRVHAAVRRHRLHVASIGAVAAFFVLAAAAVARARARPRAAKWEALRRFVALAGFFAIWVGGMGAVLARAYDEGSPWPFVGLALAVLPIALAARAWALAGTQTRVARAARAVVAGTASLAAAFLVLEVVDAQLLTGFGL